MKKNKQPHNKQRIVILTGAGISAESGLQTFRASDGLWHKYRIEDIASPEGFKHNPQLVHDFYNARRRQLQDSMVQPNPAHRALAKLEQQHSGKVFIVTQNVDNLHERAGSQHLLHMHGELLQMRCTKSGKVFPLDGDINTDMVCQCCHEAGHLRPHIVWFGEMPLAMERIYYELENCDLFMSIGTSGQVYPAAGFVQIASQAGAHTVELNLERSAISRYFDEGIYGLASLIIPKYIENLLSK
ncbi:MAG: NAD-dependent protein deacylase [Proteobacteria bacterium]|nr:MAG: NAD-dependent protein deacylase [Pseudomonadota bacterium]